MTRRNRKNRDTQTHPLLRQILKLSPVGYIVEDQDTHFVANPNTSASTHTRQEKKRELYMKANGKLTEETIKQFNKEKEWQAT
jgi:hypothetical protein